MFFSISLLLLTVPLTLAGDVFHWTIGSIIIKDPTTIFRLDIYSPTTPGSYPVLTFLTGLSGSITASAYSTMLKNVASQNVITIGLSKIEDIKPEKVADHIDDFLQWIIKPDDGAARLFAQRKEVQGVTPDVNRLGFLTHSAAGHPIAQYLNSTCGPLKLLIMLDPVDGLDPFGIFNDFITHPPNPLPFRIPTLIISNGLDSVPVRQGFPACASSNTSNDRFYYSLYGPTFAANFTDYGHGDNIDMPIFEGVKVACGTCSGTQCNYSQYKFEEATFITTFVYGILNRDVDLLKVIQEPQVYFKSRIESKFDLHGYDYSTGGPGGFCTHD